MRTDVVLQCVAAAENERARGIVSATETQANRLSLFAIGHQQLAYRRNLLKALISTKAKEVHTCLAAGEMSVRDWSAYCLFNPRIDGAHDAIDE